MASSAVRKALGIAGGYAFFGVVWIVFSDQAIIGLATDAHELTRLQTGKGWLFVAVTAALVFAMSRAVLAREARLADELRASEAALRTLNAELEQRVHERTAELEAANQALEAFSWSVSHDLKTPLRGIDGYSKLLLDDYGARLDDEGRAYLTRVRAGVSQMHRLIDALLAYARMDRRAAARRPVPLATAVQAVLAEREGELAARGIGVELDVPEITLETDPEGLALVLRNLLDNAIKFSAGAAEPRIAIGAHPGEQGTTLWIQDNGIGFDMKFQERIFELFSRLEPGDRYPGTGVGLAMVRKALARMGAHVRAESEPGRGARFVVDLPT